MIENSKNQLPNNIEFESTNMTSKIIKSSNINFNTI